ncbi:MAG: Ig-like domain-containing protein, partial [Propionibacteriaceae bacterium]|nr:Ig-like domain-containing protein [Propionibacteriaceae bacterium]
VYPLSYDLASGQTATVVQGTVYNDTAGDGSVTGDTGLGGQKVALYLKDANSGSWVYQGYRITNDSGDYSFLVGGNGEYVVRLVNPSLNGVHGWQTWADGGGTLNAVVAQCANGNVSTATGGACVGAIAAPTADPLLPSAASAAGTDTSLQPGAMPMYTTVTITSYKEVVNADFGVNFTADMGDSVAGPATIAAGAPVHNNPGTPVAYFGQTWGNNTAPSTTNADTTDDGVYVDSYAGKLSLTGTVMASTKSYNLAADVNGSKANLAYVNGWTTGAGNNTWSATPTWNPTLTGNKATGAFKFGSAAVAGTPAVQFRANVSTAQPPITSATNTTGQYQALDTAGTPNWTTAGEIEDYSFNVADAVYRPAAKTTGGAATVMVGGNSINATTALTVSAAKGAAAGTPVTLTATAPTGWNVTSVTIKDTETGDVIATPATTAVAGGVSFSYTPALGSDVIIEATFAKNPDPDKSSLTLDPTTGTAQAGGTIKAVATVKDSDNNLLSGVRVTFAKKSADITVTGGNGDMTCTTDATGTCSVDVSSNVAKTYAGEISATIPVDGVAKPISGSPKDVTFTVGTFSYEKSTLSVSPTANMSDSTTWKVADGTDYYTGILTAKDDLENLLTDLAPGDIAFAASSSKVSFTSVANNHDGTYTVKYTTTVADGTPVASVTYQNTEVKTATGASALPIPFQPGPEVNGPITCTDPTLTGTNLAVDKATLPVDTTSTATAHITDKDCNPKPGVIVTFTLNPPGSAVVTTVQGTTDANGNATATITDTKAETVTVHAATANIPEVYQPRNVTFTPGPVDPSKLTFTVSPTVTLTDNSNWPVANGTDAYTGTLTVTDKYDNPIDGVPAADIAFAKSSADVQMSAMQPGPAGSGTYTVTYTSTVADRTPVASVTYQTKLVQTAKPIPFKPGAPVGPGPKCADGRELSNTKASPASLPVNEQSAITVLVTDKFCNPIPNAPVSLALNAGTSGLLGATTGATGSDGSPFTTTLDDTKVEIVTVSATSGSTSAGSASVSFLKGTFSAANSLFTVDPVVTTTDRSNWKVADGVQYYTGTLQARDDSPNGGQPMPGLTASDIVFASSAPSNIVTVTGFAESATTPGTYTVQYKTMVADATYTASVAYQGGPVGTAKPIPFKAGPLPDGPVPDCTTPIARPGMKLSAAPTSVPVNGNSTITALVTDVNCNPIEGATVNFSQTVSTASLTPTTPQTTNAAGIATVSLTDTAPGTVPVSATATADGVTKPVGTASVTFTTGGFSYEKSTFTVAPAVTTANNSTWKVADGVQSYTGTLTAVDGNNVPLTGLKLTDIVFSSSAAQGIVNVVGLAESTTTPGTYTVQYTTTVADPTYTASVTYQGTAVKTAAGATTLPIPFKAGAAKEGPFNCTTPIARPGTNLSVAPASVGTGGTSVATALVTDENCNPVPNEPVTFDVTKSATVNGSTTAVVVNTDQAGNAKANVSDQTAEIVDVSATIAAGKVDDPKPVEFTRGGFCYLPGTSSFSVVPQASLSDKSTWKVADGVQSYTGTLVAEDCGNNPLPGLKLTDIVFSSSSPTTINMTSVVESATPGTYTVQYSTKVADGTYTASVKYQGTTVGDPKAIPFKAGAEKDGPFNCTTPIARPGTNLSASPTTLAIGNTSTATALVTDENCNPIEGAQVTFTSSPSTSSVAPTTAQTTGADGKATAQVGSTAEGQVTVSAT